MKYLFSLAALITLFSCVKEEPSTEYLSLVANGDLLPEFVITSTDGEVTFDSGDIDKATLIYFFMNTCPDCHKTTIEIMELWEDELYGDESIDLISIGRGGGSITLDGNVTFWSEMAEFSSPIEAPTLFFDEDREVYNKFAEKGVPRFYLVNSEGVVIWQRQSRDVTKEELSSMINGL